MPFGSPESARGIKLRPPPKPPKKEKDHLMSPPNPITNSNPNTNLDTIPSPMPAGEGSSGDAALGGSQFLSREEVLRRRSHRAKQLLRVYRRHYWSLVEEIRVKHRDYYWENGKSPMEEDGNEEDGERKLCGSVPCKSKAMPLTRFCHQHILADGKQRLYKACVFVNKSAHGLHITCGKPVLRATTPSLCPGHYQKVQKQISTALKKATGVTSSSKPAPKFHVLIAECVREIQARRRKALNATGDADKVNKPPVSSLKITNQMGRVIIGKDMPLPVEENCTVSGGLLQENHIEGMMGCNPSQTGSMATFIK